MTRPPALPLALALCAVVAPPAGAAAGSRLRPFHSCADLSRYARAHARTAVPPVTAVPSPATGPVTEDGSSNGTASPETPPSSGTNVQEPGIDEPDLVKTDAGTLFTVAGGKLHAIDARAATPALLSSVPIEGGGDAQLLEHDGRLLVISRAYAPVPEPPPNVGVANAATAIAPGAGATVFTEVDARDPSAMRIVRTLRLDGAFVDARQKEAVAGVVVSAVPTVGSPSARTRHTVSPVLASIPNSSAHTEVSRCRSRASRGAAARAGTSTGSSAAPPCAIPRPTTAARC